MHEVATKDVLDEIDFLARSANRVQLLNKLRGNGQVHRDELKAACNSSRTTLQRNLNALEENGWIEQSNRIYTLTAKGEIATQHFFELIDAIQAVKRLEPLLERMGSNEIDFNPQSLSEGDISVANPHDPYGPTDGVLSAVNTAKQIKVMLPAVAPYGAEATCQRVTSANVDMEILVDEETRDILFSEPVYKPHMKEMLDTGRCTLFATEKPISYYIGLFDDTVTQFGVVDEDGVPYALVETRSNDARQTAEQAYMRYKQQATPFTLDSE